MPDTPLVEFILVADLHLRENDPLGKGVGPDNTRTRKKFEILERAVKLVTESKAKHPVLMLLGDIFDNPRIPEWMRQRFFTTLHPAIDKGWVVYIGDNHTLDRGVWPFGSESTIAHALRGPVQEIVDGRISIDRWCRFTMWECDDNLTTVGGWRLGVVPFGFEQALFEWGNSEEAERTIIFGHWPVMGAFYGQTKSDKGVNVADLLQFHSAFLGDFHRRQDVLEPSAGIPERSNQDSLESERFRGYVGSAAGTDFGEAGYEHHFGVLRLYEYPKYELEWVETGDVPMLVEDIGHSLITDEWPPFDLQLLADFDQIAHASQRDSGSLPIVKLRFHGSREALASLDQRPYLEALSGCTSFIRVETVLLEETECPDVEQEALGYDPRDDHAPEVIVAEAVSPDQKARQQVGLNILKAVSTGPV